MAIIKKTNKQNPQNAGEDNRLRRNHYTLRGNVN
jgi:hypothetical protein